MASPSKSKTMNKKNKKNSTKRVSFKDESNSLRFQKEITIKFLEMLVMIKLFHWKTFDFSTHKATDELYANLNGNVDKFIEVLLGKTGLRTDLLKVKQLKMVDLKTNEQLKEKISHFKKYLVDLKDNKFMKTMENTDLYNIRDEILSDLNQFLYLLTLS
jgi:DNA-binding ferritin-like protein